MTSSALASTDRISDRLFSGSSLRCITAANIREREQLRHVLCSIDSARKSYGGEYDHQRKAMLKRQKWLQGKLLQRPWRRYAKTQPSKNNAMSHVMLLDDVRDSFEDLLLPFLDDNPTTRQGDGFATQLTSYGVPNHHRPSISGRQLTLEDIHRLVIQLHRAGSDIPLSDPATPEEQILLDKITRAVTAVERHSARRQRTLTPSNSEDILRRLAVALGADLSNQNNDQPATVTETTLTEHRHSQHFYKFKVTPRALPAIRTVKPRDLYIRDWTVEGRTQVTSRVTDQEWAELQYCCYLRDSGAGNRLYAEG